MASDTITQFTGQAAVAHNCWCGIQFAVPASLNAHWHKQNAAGVPTSIYCPLGHASVPASEDPEKRRLRRELEEAQRRARIAEGDAGYQRDRASRAEASRRVTKGHLTRARRRAAAAVCPAGCHRHFTNLARHLKTKHPDWVRAARRGDDT